MSIWLQGFQKNTKQNKLEKKQTDICIIGGGIAGMSVAFALKDSDYNILLIDKGTIGFGATAYTTAKISYLQELPYSKIASMHGEDSAKRYFESQKEAFDLIADYIDHYQINCDYEKVREYILATKEKQVSKLKKEEQYLKNWKIPYITIEAIPLPISIQYGLGVEGAVFHPLKYIYGLKKIIENKITICENVCAKEIQKKNDQYFITTDMGIIEATYVVVCTHYPFFIKPGYIPLKTHVEKSYVIASKTKKSLPLSCITTGLPMHSIRYHENYLLYGSYAHALTNHLDDGKNFEHLKIRFQNHFQTKIDCMWFNQDMISNDGLPFIGEIEKGSHLFLATAFQTWGMTNGVLAGQVIADIIQKGTSPYEDLFAIKRGWNLMRSIHFLVDGVRYGKIYLQTTLIKNPKFYQNHVCVAYENGIRIGIYIDENGVRHKVLNTCPHMKCHLIFNEQEKTWDCPCHSSRFDIDGNVIRGPSSYSIRIDF